MFFKKIAILVSLLMFSLCGCNNLSDAVNDTSSDDYTSQEDTTLSEEVTTAQASTDEEIAQDVEILNFKQPEIGEEIAVITVKDFGTIKIKLFEDECPKGVENFKRLISEKNYYDDIIFHRVIEGFVIQAGDPNGNGTGGESIWGDGFEREFNDGLRHFAGAVAYATNSVDHLNKSQFYIVSQNNGYDFNESYFNMMEDSYGVLFPNNVREKYQEVGGTPYLDGDYEVFGQVFDGMDVVLAISQVETDSNDKPYDDIIIESATIEEYDGSPITDGIGSSN
ncbi:MAG: peptidylprolyl isomerase [Ruminococcus sp.]|nr:peptidylprolyl isomerase [Ruminococcus sp.]